MSNAPLKIAAFFVVPIAAVCVFGSLGFAALYTGSRRAAAITGPCSGSQRLASQDTYQRLALKLVFTPLNVEDRLLPARATPERVDRQLARIADLRATYLPSVTDTCLAAHVADWLDHYEREARTAMSRKAELNGFASEYDKRRAEEEDQVRALKAALGAKPATPGALP